MLEPFWTTRPMSQLNTLQVICSLLSFILIFGSLHQPFQGIRICPDLQDSRTREDRAKTDFANETQIKTHSTSFPTAPNARQRLKTHFFITVPTQLVRLSVLFACPLNTRFNDVVLKIGLDGSRLQRNASNIKSAFGIRIRVRFLISLESLFEFCLIRSSIE